MNTLDKQIYDLLAPVLAAAKANDPRLDALTVIVNNPLHLGGVYCGISGYRAKGAMGYGIEKTLESVQQYDPRAARLEEIEKLKAELAALEQSTSEAK